MRLPKPDVDVNTGLFFTVESAESAEKSQNPCELCVLCGEINAYVGDRPTARETKRLLDFDPAASPTSTLPYSSLRQDWLFEQWRLGFAHALEVEITFEQVDQHRVALFEFAGQETV